MTDNRTFDGLPPGPWTYRPSIPQEGFECFFVEDEEGTIVIEVPGPQNADREQLARAIASVPDLLKENERLRKAATPVCIGAPLIGILAKEGAWQSSDGQCVVAADDLHGNDPYALVAELREALRPFAHWYDLNDCDGRSGVLEVPITDLRNARAAYIKSAPAPSPNEKLAGPIDFPRELVERESSIKDESGTID